MEQPDGATEANQRDEILRSFSAGGAYSKRRDLWLLVSARNSETRSRLRNDGILHLALAPPAAADASRALAPHRRHPERHVRGRPCGRGAVCTSLDGEGSPLDQFRTVRWI